MSCATKLLRESETCMRKAYSVRVAVSLGGVRVPGKKHEKLGNSLMGLRHCLCGKYGNENETHISCCWEKEFMEMEKAIGIGVIGMNSWFSIYRQVEKTTLTGLSGHIGYGLCVHMFPSAITSEAWIDDISTAVSPPTPAFEFQNTELDLLER